MSELKISGKVDTILDVQKGVSKAGKDWQKQTFVINTGADFNPLAAFGVFGEDKCKEIIGSLSVGDDVEVSFNLSSREWEGKYFTQADAWRVSKASSDTSTPETAKVAMAETDDLPF